MFPKADIFFIFWVKLNENLNSEKEIIPLTKSLGDERVEQWRTQENDDDEMLLVDPAKIRRKVETNAIVVAAASER